MKQTLLVGNEGLEYQGNSSTVIGLFDNVASLLVAGSKFELNSKKQVSFALYEIEVGKPPHKVKLDDAFRAQSNAIYNDEKRKHHVKHGKLNK